MATSKEYGFGEYDFPRGWFVVGESAKVTSKPQGVRFFGNDMVLYRGESGRVVMLDAYCAHMGTHLGCNSTSATVLEGRHVEGDSIRCPYHAWRFGPDGVCNDIPYSDMIPTGARIRAWEVVEAQDFIYAWHDPEGLAPDFDLPAIPEWDDPAWIKWTITDLGEMNTHPVEFLDNMADVGHVRALHGAIAQNFENEIRGHMIWQRQYGHVVSTVYAATDVAGGFNTHYVGPGILTSRQARPGDVRIERIAHTPVNDGTARVWHAVMIKSPHEVATPEDIATLAPIAEEHKGGFAQDFEIWKNKRACIRPMQLPTDGNFLQVRRWYRQFYYPRAKTAELLENVEGIYKIRGVPDFPMSSPLFAEEMNDPNTSAFAMAE